MPQGFEHSSHMRQVLFARLGWDWQRAGQLEMAVRGLEKITIVLQYTQHRLARADRAGGRRRLVTRPEASKVREPGRPTPAEDVTVVHAAHH